MSTAPESFNSPRTIADYHSILNAILNGGSELCECEQEAISHDR